MRRVRLSDNQRAILRALKEGRAPYLHYYRGEVGTEGRGAGFYWKQRVREPLPPTPGNAVNGLITRGLLAYVGDGDYEITQAGRETMGEGA